MSRRLKSGAIQLRELATLRAEIFALPFVLFAPFRGYSSSPLFQPRDGFIVRGGGEPAAPGSGSGGAIKNDRIGAGRKHVAWRVLPAIKANGASDTLKELVLFARRKMDVTTHAPSRVEFL